MGSYCSVWYAWQRYSKKPGNTSSKTLELGVLGTQTAPALISTELMAFPDIPQPSQTASGQSPQYVTDRGIAKDNVQKILGDSNLAVTRINKILSNHNHPPLGDRLDDVYKILNYGEEAQIQALEKWLNQFKDFLDSSQDQAIKNLIKDLIELSSKST
jgi:hypothetical protein